LRADGHQQLERPASREGSIALVRLSYRLHQPDDEPEYAGEVLKVGDRCDVRYKGGWFKGEVTKTTRFNISVKRDGFDGYPSIELLKRDEGIAKFDTKTEGKDTRGVVKQGEIFVINDESLDAMQDQVDSIIRGQVTLEAAHEFIKTQLAPFVEKALSSKVDTEHQDQVYRFTQTVLRLCIYFLARPEPLHPSIRQQLERIFLGDKRCNFFFTQRQHGIFGTAPEAKDFIGDTAKFPDSGASKFFIGNVNYFGEMGAYEIMARRIDSATGF